MFRIGPSCVESEKVVLKPKQAQASSPDEHAPRLSPATVCSCLERLSCGPIVTPCLPDVACLLSLSTSFVRSLLRPYRNAASRGVQSYLVVPPPTRAATMLARLGRAFQKRGAIRLEETGVCSTAGEKHVLPTSTRTATDTIDPVCSGELRKS